MKKQTHNPWLGTVAALCATGLSAYAGSVTYDFDTDPSGILQLFGNATYSSTGGNPDTGGYLSLTEAVGSQRSAIVFDDFDNGSVVKAFSFSMDVRIGGGTDTPADGFSVNYVRANDPVITTGDPLNNWATGLNGEADLPEEGSTTGLGIGFDAYDSGGGDVIGISVRVDNVLVAQYPLPTKNGAAGDTTSLQTGPIDTANPGSADLLAWEPFSVDLSETGVLVIKYKGVEITPAGGLQTTFAPSPGRLVLVARTGGSNQNQHVDNIKITTIPAALALVGNATGLPDGFTVTLNDSGASVIDTTQITAKLNGTAVTPTTTKTGGATTVTYRGYPALLTPGATNTVDVVAKDTVGNTITGSRTFTTAAFATVPVGDVVPVASIDTTKTGFRLLPWQSGTQPNAIYYTEEQLSGLHGPNVADLTTATDGGYVDVTGPINFNGDGTDTGIPGDTTFPGIPGPDGHTGNSSFEALTYLNFPAAGVYQMGVSSDDGFKVTSGLSAQDRFAPVLGQFNGGKGASDVLFYVVVPAAGYYPFRLIYENGNGDAGNGLSCEWFIVNTDGTKSLVGDTSDANSIKAYYSGPQFAAHVSHVAPYPGQTGARPDFVVVQLKDGASVVNAGSIQLSLNGSVASAPPTKVGAVTTVKANLSGANLLPPGGTNSAVIVWADSATPAAAHTNAWTFVTMNYVTLNPGLASPAGSGDPAQAGYSIKVNQLDPSTVGDTGDVTGNNIESAESQLAGLYSPAFGDNVADTSTATSGNTWNVTTPVDYLSSGTSPAGNFGGDLALPGIPGTTGITDMIAAEFKGYADLAPGFYVMGVNSDDGFRVTEATSVSRQVLHISGTGINQDIHVVNTTTNNSSYGGSLPTTPITAPLVYVTTNSCPDIPDLTGKIAVVDLQRCGSGDSDVVLASKMQSNGAVAVVIINVPSFGLSYIGSGTPSSPVTIPVLMTSGFAGGADVLKTNANLTASIGADSSLKLGEFNGNGRGTADTLFGFVVPTAGVYPLRMVYQNGNGGAAVEWFSLTTDGLTSDGGTKILVNDSATAGSVLLYRGTTAVSLPTLSVTGSSTEIVITYTGTLLSSDTVNGTYTPVAGATSPLHVPFTAGAAKFYRTSN